MEYEIVNIGVKYNIQTYGGSIRPAKIEVSSVDTGVRIKIDGRGYAYDGNVEVFGGMLVPRTPYSFG